MDVVASLQNALAIAGKLRDLSKKIEDAEFKMYLADLSNELADAKLEAANLKIEMSKLATRCHELEQQLKQRSAGKPRLEDGVYMFEGDEGQYCTACFDVRGQKVNLTKLSSSFRAIGKWRCPACEAVFNP
jgi:predicted nuclease with TOPRIM domain